MEWYVGRSGTALMQNWGRRITQLSGITQLHPMMLCELALSGSVVGMSVLTALHYSVSALLAKDIVTVMLW